MDEQRSVKWFHDAARFIDKCIEDDVLVGEILSTLAHDIGCVVRGEDLFLPKVSE